MQGMRMTGAAEFRRLWCDPSGTALLEFAVIFPAFILALIGIIEVAIVLFISSSIEAAVLEASRFGITGGTPEEGVSREDRVLEIVAEKTYGLVDMDDVELDTLVYASFDDIGEPEPFEDDNTNGIYDMGEPYTDVNGNGQWDADMGAAGLGGPSDVVVYRISYQWGLITPLMRKTLSETVRHTSSVAVRNEPF
jgi:hypothetical protein